MCYGSQYWRLAGWQALCVWAGLCFLGAVSLAVRGGDSTAAVNTNHPTLGVQSVAGEATKPASKAKPLGTNATLSGLVRYDGPLEGPIVVQAWQPHPANRALKLDGDGDYVITSLTNLSGSELTIQYWFKGSSMQSAVRQQNGDLSDLASEWSGKTGQTAKLPPHKGWIVATWNQFFILSHDGLLSGVYGSVEATNGHWHQVTMTWKQNTPGGFANYLDGRLVTIRDSRDVPIPDFQTPVMLGTRDGKGEYCNGLLDEVAIWKRAWTGEEIRANWNRKLTGNEPGLAGYWNFDDAAPTNRFPAEFKGDACAVAADIPGLGAPVRWVRLEQPGAYQLTNLVVGAEYRIQAFLDLNGDGGWNPGEPRGELPSGTLRIAGDLAKVNLRLSLPVPFWRSWPFYTLCFLAAVAVAAGVIRAVMKRRFRRQIEVLERQHYLEKERSRIARDIHDDVGSSLTHIAWLSQMAEKEKQDPARVEAYTRKISACSQQMVQAIDEIVWAVNPGNDSLQSLTQYIAHHVYERLSGSPVNFRLNIPADLPAFWMPSEMRHELFLAVKEAVNNALKHAAATEINIGVQVQQSLLNIAIEDNGRGFDPAARPAGRRGNGLDNIKQRVENAGGSLQCHSGAQGTQLALTVKLSAAPVPISSGRTGT